jgi:hypothetical protein
VLTIIQVNHMVNEIYDYVVMGIESTGCCATSASFTNESHNYGFDSSVGH